MPYHKSAKKRVITSKKAESRNRQVKSKIHSTTKKILESETKENLQIDVNRAYSIIDKAVKKNVIHKNKAAHLKSRLAKKSKAPAQ